MTPKADAAEIARKLTPAQAKAISALPADRSAAAYRGNEASLYALARKVIGDPKKAPAIIYSLCEQAGQTAPTRKRMWGENLWRLTPLGLEVRRILEGQSQ